MARRLLRGRAMMIRLALLVCFLASSGCYYTFGTSPSPRHAVAAVDEQCTTSRSLPIADTVVAATGAAAAAFGGAALLTKDDGSMGAGEARGFAAMFVAMGGVMLIANGLSAYAGFRDTAVCRASHPHDTNVSSDEAR
jgi:hypothetical protein